MDAFVQITFVRFTFKKFRIFQEWENNDTKITIGYFLVFVSMMFNIFVFCFLSEKLSHEVASNT